MNKLRRKPLRKYGRPVNPERKMHTYGQDPHPLCAKKRALARNKYLYNLTLERKFREHGRGYGMSISMCNRLIEERKHLK